LQTGFFSQKTAMLLLLVLSFFTAFLAYSLSERAYERAIKLIGSFFFYCIPCLLVVLPYSPWESYDERAIKLIGHTQCQIAMLFV
jgi:hypothetical protein